MKAVNFLKYLVLSALFVFLVNTLSATDNFKDRFIFKEMDNIRIILDDGVDLNHLSRFVILMENISKLGFEGEFEIIHSSKFVSFLEKFRMTSSMNVVIKNLESFSGLILRSSDFTIASSSFEEFKRASKDTTLVVLPIDGEDVIVYKDQEKIAKLNLDSIETKMPLDDDFFKKISSPVDFINSELKGSSPIIEIFKHRGSVDYLTIASDDISGDQLGKIVETISIAKVKSKEKFKEKTVILTLDRNLKEIGDFTFNSHITYAKLKAINSKTKDAKMVISSLKVDEILIIEVENLPKSVYEYLLRSSDFPAIVSSGYQEEVMIRSGMPYLNSTLKHKLMDIPVPIQMANDQLVTSHFTDKNYKMMELFIDSISENSTSRQWFLNSHMLRTRDKFQNSIFRISEIFKQQLNIDLKKNTKVCDELINTVINLAN